MFFNPVCGNGAAYTSKFKAYREAVQSIPSLTLTKVEFNFEQYDGESEYDKDTNHRFIVKETGKYKLAACVCIAGILDVKSAYAQLILNGSNIIGIAHAKPGSEGTISLAPGTEIELTVDDYIEVHVYQTNITAANTGIDSSCQFYGHRIG